MLSEATGTTPSLQDNKGRRDAIIPHQFLSVFHVTLHGVYSFSSTLLKIG
jgi:hypothetical protein